jgi:hypothetical protein
MSEQFEQGEVAARGAWQAVAIDLAHCVRFYSRLPVPVLPWEQDAHALPSFLRLVRMVSCQLSRLALPFTSISAPGSPPLSRWPPWC